MGGGDGGDMGSMASEQDVASSVEGSSELGSQGSYGRTRSYSAGSA